VDWVIVPGELARLLAGQPVVGATEQAFPFLTVDEGGFPHVALLSRAEIGLNPDGTEVFAAVASRRTRANLEREGRAGLIAVDGITAHYAKLQLMRTIQSVEALGCALRVSEFKADSLGVPLSPISFGVTAEIARLDGWEASRQLLRRLADGRT
jgi:hypothetical protein